MTISNEAIQDFIRIHGNTIKEECEKRLNNPYFIQRDLEEEYEDVLYSVNEEGFLRPMTVKEGKTFKKRYKKHEINNKIAYNQLKRFIKPFDIIQAFFPYNNETGIYSIQLGQL